MDKWIMLVHIFITTDSTPNNFRTLSLYLTKTTLEARTLIFSPAQSSCRHTAFSKNSCIFNSRMTSVWRIFPFDSGYNWKIIVQKISWDEGGDIWRWLTVCRSYQKWSLPASSEPLSISISASSQDHWTAPIWLHPRRVTDTAAAMAIHILQTQSFCRRYRDRYQFPCRPSLLWFCQWIAFCAALCRSMISVRPGYSKPPNSSSLGPGPWCRYSFRSAYRMVIFEQWWVNWRLYGCRLLLEIRYYRCHQWLRYCTVRLLSH